MTLAPEHELVSKITTEAQKDAVQNYIKATAKRSERERMADVKTISGVFTGAYAIHPFSGEKIQIFQTSSPKLLQRKVSYTGS